MKKMRIQNPPEPKINLSAAFHAKKLLLLCAALSLFFPLQCKEARAMKTGPEKAGIYKQAEKISEYQVFTHDIWFYTEKLETVIPEPAYSWVIVKFANLQQSAENGLPKKLKETYSALNGWVDHYIYFPSVSEDIVAYKLASDKAGQLASVLDKIKSQGRIDYIRPALKIDDKLYGATDRIKIKWKSSAGREVRQSLLDKIYAEEFTDLLENHSEEIGIDSKEIPVWKAANILAEDIYTVYSHPVLFELKQPIDCNLALGLAGGTIGTPLPFKVKIEFQDYIKLNPGSVVNIDLAPEDISESLFDIEYNKPLSTIDISTSPVTIEGRMYVYTPGEFSIPEIPVAYKYEKNKKTRVRRENTQKAFIKIGSIIPESQKKFELMTAGYNGPIEIFKGLKKGAGFYLTFSLLSFIIGASSIFYFFFLLKKNKRTVSRPQITDKKNFYYALIDFSKKDVEDFDMSTIKELIKNLRCYISEAYEVPHAKAGGSPEVFAENLKDYASLNVNEKLLGMELAIEDMMAIDEINKDKLKAVLNSLEDFTDLVESETSQLSEA